MKAKISVLPLAAIFATMLVIGIHPITSADETVKNPETIKTTTQETKVEAPSTVQNKDSEIPNPNEIPETKPDLHDTNPDNAKHQDIETLKKVYDNM